jgi:hypothetical protein
MVVDLSQFRNSTDGRIADAIAFAADRSWLYSSRNPAVETALPNDPGHRSEFSRRTGGREGGRPYTLHLPDVEKLPAAAGDHAASGMDQTRPGSSDNQVDWSSLSPAELNKRLFGDRFGH